MKYAFYRGHSTVSRLIRWVTRGPYSHVAMVLRDGSVIEAWHQPPFVRRIRHLGEGHESGTQVDVYSVILPDEDAAEQHLIESLGRKYDFKGVLGFLTRSKRDRSKGCFCSELGLEASIKGLAPLLERVPAWRVSPSQLSTSPRFTYLGSVHTRKEGTVTP